MKMLSEYWNTLLLFCGMHRFALPRDEQTIPDHAQAALTSHFSWGIGDHLFCRAERGAR